MRNLFLLFLAVTFASTTFAQKGWDISAGATVFAPIAKNVNWDSKFWGQRVTFTKKSVNVTLGYMQNKAGNAQIPVLVGTEKGLGKVFKVGLRGFSIHHIFQCTSVARCFIAGHTGIIQCID